MTSSDTVTETAAPSPVLFCPGEGRPEWVDRCRASIAEREPLLAAADVLDLAATLWGLPRCRVLSPEFAAGLLVEDKLGRLE